MWVVGFIRGRRDNTGAHLVHTRSLSSLQPGGCLVLAGSLISHRFTQGGTSGVVVFTGSLGYLVLALGSLDSFEEVGFSRVCPRVRLVEPLGAPHSTNAKSNEPKDPKARPNEPE